MATTGGRRVGQPWMTMSVGGLTAVTGAAQWVSPAVVANLQRDPSRLGDGQWWRVLTPLFVQPSGLGQYVFNLLGVVLVGVVVERRYGPGRWATIYLAGGLAGNIVESLWFPHETGGGSSDAVAALIAAFAVATWGSGRVESWGSYFYSVFFVGYLAALAADGVIAGTIVGDAMFVVAAFARRTQDPKVQVRALVGLSVAAAIVMTTLRDSHGPGLIAGFAAGALLIGSASQKSMMTTGISRSVRVS